MGSGHLKLRFPEINRNDKQTTRAPGFFSDTNLFLLTLKSLVSCETRWTYHFDPPFTLNNIPLVGRSWSPNDSRPKRESKITTN